jgi:hypothetical protein
MYEQQINATAIEAISKLDFGIIKINNLNF